jgi:acetyl esterase/lipase
MKGVNSMCKDYDQLVKLIEKGYVQHENGLEFVVKNIPGEENTEGKLDPRVFQILNEQYKKQRTDEMPDLSQLEIKDIPVEMLRNQMGWNNRDITKIEIKTSDELIDGKYGTIPIKIYSPQSNTHLPAIVYFHGGGFFGGTVKVVENPCKALAERANAVVISVDYRLAPENPYPAGLTDCFDSVKWVYKYGEKYNIDSTKIAVSGDSAGANFATVCAMMDRDLKTNMIKFQALIYPTVNMAAVDTEEYKWSLDQYNITDEHRKLIMAGLEGMKNSQPLVKKLYLQNNEDATHPYISPIFAESLKGMPETLIFTAEFDYLRLEAEAYGRKLAKFGVKTKIIQYKGMDHAFIDKLGIYPQAEDCINEIAKGIKSLFKN